VLRVIVIAVELKGDEKTALLKAVVVVDVVVDVVVAVVVELFVVEVEVVVLFAVVLVLLLNEELDASPSVEVVGVVVEEEDFSVVVGDTKCPSSSYQADPTASSMTKGSIEEGVGKPGFAGGVGKIVALS